jgi:hypothetical protein
MRALRFVAPSLEIHEASLVVFDPERDLRSKCADFE